MKHGRYVALVCGLAVAAAAPVRADDDAKAARALVDKAIKAHGGAEAIAKYKAAIVSFKGTFHGMGMEVPMTGEISTHGPDRLKVDVEVEAGGMKFKFASVMAGDKGWIKLGENTAEMDKDAVAEATEQAHAGWVASLTPLVEGKGFILATTGEQMVGEKKAVGVRVSAKDRRDVTLFFDTETNLLVKYEHRVKDEGTGQEVTEENFPTEYKDVQGTKQAMKFTAKRDGKLHIEGEVTDLQLAEKLDPKVFAKP
jgi:hypothetical protein